MSNPRLSDPVFTDSLDSAIRRFFSPSSLDSDFPPMRMPIDVCERDGIYEVKADLAGVKKEDINVRIDGNLVQIDAQANQGQDSKASKDKILRSERYHGTITRTFSMAEDIDDAKVSAKYAEGVLTLELPKKATSTLRKIAIQ